MKYSIQWEVSGPCYASEADKERGAQAYINSIRSSGFDIERLLIAQDDRTLDIQPCPWAAAALEAADFAAEPAVTEGWVDYNAESGVTYHIERD